MKLSNKKLVQRADRLLRQLNDTLTELSDRHIELPVEISPLFVTNNLSHYVLSRTQRPQQITVLGEDW